MQPSFYLTLSQAAKETGKSKGTISKYIKNGKLAYVSKDELGYKIDPAELFRVFPQKKQETPSNERLETPEKPMETMRLRHELELTRKDLQHEREKSKSLETERDKWQEQAEQTLRLTDQRQPKNQNWAVAVASTVVTLLLVSIVLELMK